MSEQAPSEALKQRLFQDLPGDVKEEVMTYADMLREEGEKRGEQRALQRAEELAQEKAHFVAVDALTRLLQVLFGPLPSWVVGRLETFDEGTLLELIPQAVSASSLEALLGSVPSPAPSAT